MPKVLVNGQTITLNKKDFIAQGGEGSVYAVNKTAYKIYNDSSKMIPASKMKELSALTMPNIIKPEEVVYSGKKPVGYTMKNIPKNVSLCQIFTKAFKDRNNITPEISFDLVKRMQETVEHIHSKKILIVDLNEMNFLTCTKFKEVYFIDVDSYQTPSHHATALMESVRDRHSAPNKFTTNTDWFSFAIVSFQIFIGIHPYKGKHPTLSGFDERMINNVSVFNKDVNTPKCCLPLTVIPNNWKDWYKAVFEKGFRSAPPSTGDSIINIITVVKLPLNSTNFEIVELYECESIILNFESNFGNDCVVCQDGLRTKSGKNIASDSNIIGYYRSTPYSAKIENDRLKIFNVVMKTDVSTTDIAADELMSSKGRIYIKQNDKILEVEFVGSEQKPMISAKIVSNVMEKATKLYPGVAIQNMLGSYYASIFVDSGKCVQCRLTDLDKYQIVNAKYEHGILMVIAVINGKYDRFIYSVDDIANPRIVKDLQGYGINFTVLDNGTCISITDNEEVEIFHNKNIHKIKAVQDNVINSGMRLFHDGNVVLFSEGKKMFSIKMKTK